MSRSRVPDILDFSSFVMMKRSDHRVGVGCRAFLISAIALISCWTVQPARALQCGAQDIAPGQGASAITDAGLEWRVVRRGGGFTSPSGSTGVGASDLAWGAGRFVAVGRHGTIVHSRDGDRWRNASDSATSEWLSGVAWSGTQFVSVGLSGTIVRSSDGERWVQAGGVETASSLQSVVWGGDAFVAVGWDGAVVHSRNGDRWELASARPTTERLNAVTWGGSRFVAVGDRGTILHSSDGDRWSAANGSTSVDMESVAWHGSGFVAAGDHGVIMRSSDGIDWSQANDSATDTRLMDVVWSGTRFVAVGRGGAIVHSSDGNRWERSPRMTWDMLASIAWSGTWFVTLGWDGAILRSPDGVAWEYAVDSSEVMRDLRAIASGDGRLVAVGNDTTILHGRGGEEWEESRVDNYWGQFLGAAWGADRFVAVGSSGMMYSLDGVRWEKGSDLQRWRNATDPASSSILTVVSRGAVMSSSPSGGATRSFGAVTATVGRRWPTPLRPRRWSSAMWSVAAIVSLRSGT